MHNDHEPENVLTDGTTSDLRCYLLAYAPYPHNSYLGVVRTIKLCLVTTKLSGGTHTAFPDYTTSGMRFLLGIRP